MPRSVDLVTITARIEDEQVAGLSVQLWWRDASTLAPPEFSMLTMVDDGSQNDGAPADGVYGAVLPALANRA